MNTRQGHSGRSALIEKLYLRIGEAGCIVVVGLPGMGKTWTANALQAKIMEKRKTIRLNCVDDWNAEDFFAELNTKLTLLTGSAAGSAANEPGKLCALLAEKSITLILDDIHLCETEAVSLIEVAARTAQGSIIAFSQKRPDLKPAVVPDVFTQILRELTEPETAEMVGSIFGFHGVRPPKDCAKIHELTNGHPLSVKLACGILLSGKTTLTDLQKADLSNFRDRYLEEFIWEMQSAEVRKMLSILSVLRIPINRKIIGAGREDSIDCMLDTCLIESDHSGAVFLPRMLKNMVLNKNGESRSRKLHLEAAGLLSSCKENPECLREAYYHFSIAGEREKAIDALLELGNLNIYLQEVFGDAAHILNREIEKGHYRNQELRVMLADQLIHLGKIEEAEAVIVSIQGFYRHFLEGNIEYMKGRTEKALALYQRILGTSGNRKFELLVSVYIAECQMAMCNFSESTRFFDEISADPALEEYPDVRALYCFTRAVVYYLNGSLTQALPLIEEALSLFRKLSVRARVVSTLNTRGYMLFLQNRGVEAESQANEAIAIAREIGDSVKEAEGYGLLAEICSLTGAYDRAIEFRLKAHDLYRLTGSRDFIGVNYISIGTAWLRLLNLADAEYYFLKGMGVVDGLEDKLAKLTAVINFCEFLIFSGRLSEAYKRLTGIRSELNGEIPGVMASFYWQLGIVLELAGRKDEAGDCFNQYRSELDKLPSQTREAIERDDAWLKGKVAETRDRTRVLRRGKNPELLDLAAADSLRGKPEKFEILADFVNSSLHVDGKEINIFRKRTLARLLREIAVKPGTEHKAAAIYPRIWGRGFVPGEDDNSFRNNISRLRRILDSKKLDRFIENTDNPNCCRFSDSVNYCILLPMFEN
ncbi:MAG: tetratricopeptide repeat protein [Candidatus Wallbacteria bacterium]|nr:tetratricopeptide repeat protein [Candidatus Wallbacteria bacterium]